MMKSLSTLVATLVAGTLLATGSVAWAHEDHHAKSESQTGSITANLDPVRAVMDSLDKDFAANRLGNAHALAEALKEAVKDLDKDPSLDAAKKKRVQGYVKNIAKLADGMHDAADAKNAPEALKWEKKLKTQVDLLVKQFGKPKAIAHSAAPETAPETK